MIDVATGPVKVVQTSALGFSTDNPDAPNDEDETTGKKTSNDANKGKIAIRLLPRRISSKTGSVFKKVAPLIASKKVRLRPRQYGTTQSCHL